MKNWPRIFNLWSPGGVFACWSYTKLWKYIVLILLIDRSANKLWSRLKLFGVKKWGIKFLQELYCRSLNEMYTWLFNRRRYKKVLYSIVFVIVTLCCIISDISSSCEIVEYYKIAVVNYWFCCVTHMRCIARKDEGSFQKCVTFFDYYKSRTHLRYRRRSSETREDPLFASAACTSSHPIPYALNRSLYSQREQGWSISPLTQFRFSRWVNTIRLSEFQFFSFNIYNNTALTPEPLWIWIPSIKRK